MNCFTHGFRFLDDPYFLVGTAVPDWLTLVDRKVRVRQNAAREFAMRSDGNEKRLAEGIAQHHQDDRWFHEHQHFVQLNLELSIELRDLLGADAGFRPHFVAHVIIEMLLDASLASKDRSQLDRYYEQVARVDPILVQQTINQIAAVPTQMITRFIPRFIEEAYLYDYFSDERTMYRMNRILKRVKLNQLPESFLGWLPSVRERVYAETNLLLRPIL